MSPRRRLPHRPLLLASLTTTAVLVAALPWARADLIISEFLASNKKSITDEDGDHSDWIEIKNTAGEPAELSGWSLTDESPLPRKWLFPAVTVPANGQILVFASGKNRAVAGHNLHTNFSLAAAGEYLALIRPDASAASEWAPAFPAQFTDTSYGLSTNVREETWLRESSALKAFVPSDNTLIPQWRALTFDDSAWTAGTFGVGYVNSGSNAEININFGTASATPMSGNGRHAYIRVPFQVSDPALVQSLKLRANYDDGFVAWLNGTRVANSAGAPAADPISPTALVANHGAAGFEDFVLPAAALSALSAGNNVLSLELMNTTNSSSDAFLSAQLVAVLTATGTGVTGFFASATPGQPNGGVNTLELPVTVSASRPSGTFSNAFDLTLSGAGAGQEIRYVLADPTGSPAAAIAEPGTGSTLYTGPISISSSKLLRAAVFENGQRGRLLTAQYLQLETGATNNTSSFSSNLPLLVLDDHGDGQPVDSGTGTHTTSLLHIFQPVNGASRLADAGTGAGIPDLFTRAGTRVRGSSSSGFAKKSYGMETWNERNEDEDLPLLGMAADSDWVLNGPFLFDDTYIHNAYAYEISRRLGRWAPRTKPCEVFFNQNGGKLDYSDYAGVYILTEKIKSNSSRLDISGLGPEDTAGEALTGGYIFKIDRADSGEVSWTINNSAFGLGTLPNTESGQSLVLVEPDPDTDVPEQTDYIRNSAIQPFNNTLFSERAASFATREYRNHIDVGSFVDHHIINALAMNVDALRLSAFYYKDRGAKICAGPVWDFDRALGSDDGRDSNPSTWNNVTYFFDRDWWGGLFKDPQFVQDWVDRWWELRQAGQPLATDALRTLADHMGAEIGNAAGARDAARWTDNAASGGVYLNEINAMKTWLNSRVTFIDNQTPGPPTTPTASGPVPAGATLTLSGSGSMRYTLDGTDPRPFGGGTPAGGTVYSGPVAINQSVILTARRQGSFTPFPQGASSIAWSAPLRRILLVNEVFAAADDLIISAVNYHPFPPTAAELAALPGVSGTDFEWLEIKNTGGRNVNLIDMVLPAGEPFDADFKFPLTSLAAGKSLLLVKNRAAFELRYGSSASALIAGEWGKGNLKDSGESIRLRDRRGNVVLSLDYSDDTPWPVLADGKGHALEYKSTLYGALDNNTPANWGISTSLNGTPGGEPPMDDPPVVFNEIMAETSSPFVDGVELRNNGSQPLDISGWFLTNTMDYPDLETAAKFRIPNGPPLPPGGFAVFSEKDFNPNGSWNPAASPGGPAANHFALDGLHGGKLVLHRRDAGGGLRFAGHADYPQMRLNESVGPRLGSPGIFDPLSRQTLFDAASPTQPFPAAGAENSGVRSGPVLLREIYHSPAGENSDFAFVELLNPAGGQALSLEFWQMRGLFSRDFSAADSIPPAGLLVVVPFSPADAAKAEAFRRFYRIDDSVPLCGPMTRSAAPAAGEGEGELRLVRARSAPAAEPALRPLTQEDRAAWRNAAADGWPDTLSGMSLNRSVLPFDGTLSSSWSAGAPSPGDYDLRPLSWKVWKVRNFGSADPGQEDPDGDGLNNFMEYAFGLDPLAPNSPEEILPVISAGSDLDGPTVLYTFSCPPARPGVLWQIEQSIDLTNWIPVPEEKITVTITDAIETHRASLRPVTGTPNLFLRLHLLPTPDPVPAP